MKQKYVYIVIGLGGETPEIVGVYTNKRTAEKAIGKCAYWCNIIKKELNTEN